MSGIKEKKTAVVIARGSSFCRKSGEVVKEHREGGFTFYLVKFIGRSSPIWFLADEVKVRGE